jgi:hypothetical protein
LPVAQHGDLWSGIGLAMGYAGPAEPADWRAAMAAAGRHAAALRQGLAFGAAAQAEAGCFTSNMQDGCEVVLRTTAAEVAALTEVLRPDLPVESVQHGLALYALWRRRVRLSLATGTLVTPERRIA